jgi:hypothetical protein
LKLLRKQRSQLAKQICREWIRKRGLRLKAPTIYVIWHEPKFEGHQAVWGMCYQAKRMITMHIVKGTPSHEWIILLAHEYAHYLDYWTSTRRWRNELQGHGQRFQQLFWNTLSKVQWARASSGHWLIGRSRHRPEYQ